MTFLAEYWKRHIHIRAGAASLPGSLFSPVQSGLGKARPPRGQALILIVFAIIGLVGITALAVDGGSAYADRRRAQNAADATALAGALARINGEQWVTQAYLVAKTNGYDNNGTTNTVTISSPPTAGPYKGDIEYIDVQITSHVRTYFAAAVGMRTITNTVDATARSKPPIRGPMFDGNAVVSLASGSDCLANKAFYVHAQATLDISGSGVLVNSQNPTCALVQQSEGSIHLEDGNSIHVVGGVQVQRPKLIIPWPPVTSWPAMNYPPPIYMPSVTCTGQAAISETDPHQMNPGNWGSADFPPKDVKTLTSGAYCLDGDFVLTGKQTLEGSDVVILMRHGQLRWSGTTVINLSAPHVGLVSGLLIYQPPENQHQMTLDAAKDSTVQGSILVPGANIFIRGNDSTYGFHSQIIGNTIEVDGSSNIVIQYAADENYWALTLPEVQLVK